MMINCAYFAIRIFECVLFVIKNGKIYPLVFLIIKFTFYHELPYIFMPLKVFIRTVKTAFLLIVTKQKRGFKIAILRKNFYRILQQIPNCQLV
jgi:hypothetical protein